VELGRPHSCAPVVHDFTVKPTGLNVQVQEAVFFPWRCCTINVSEQSFLLRADQAIPSLGMTLERRA